MRYIIVELSGNEREVSKFEFYCNKIIMDIILLSLLLVACRVIFEGIRGY